MRKIIKAMLISGLLTMSALAIAVAQDGTATRIDSVMQLAHNRGIFNGNALVAKDGKIIYAASLGYAAPGEAKALTKSLRFDIGSVSKEFNGAAIMLLKEQGKLKLDDPVSKYLPDFPAWSQQVKIRQLINYTSGIPNLSVASDETDDDFHARLMSLKQLQFEPGSAYLYSHANVYLQMRIIEKASGLSYAAFITKYILKPCNMTGAMVDAPFDGKGIASAFDNANHITPYAQRSTGWVRLPAIDLYRWAQQLDNYKVISRESYRELAVNFPGGESSLGSTKFETDSLTWHLHQGSNSNYEAVLYNHIKDGITIVLMTNNQQFKVQDIRLAIMAVLHHEPVIVPKRSLYMAIRDTLLNDFNRGIGLYRGLKKDHQDLYDFSNESNDLIRAGIYLAKRDRQDDAITILQLAIAVATKSVDRSSAYELIADAWLKKQNKGMAAVYYQLAVTAEKGNKNAEVSLKKLE